jgi:hypothetical protein
LFASAFSVSDDQDLYGTIPSESPFLNDLLDENVKTFLKPEEGTKDFDFNLFDYRKALTDWGISYINCRDPSVIEKFANDPFFSRVFINEEVSVFKVKVD